MTKLILFSAENIKKAKSEISALAREFVKLEPKNPLIIPDTKPGSIVIDQIFAKLESMGYSPEDAQLLTSEVVEAIIEGHETDTPSPITPTPKNDIF